MLRIRKMKGRSYGVVLLAVGIAAVAALAGCWDEPTAPIQEGEQEILQPGLNVYLTIDKADGAPATLVHVVAKVRAVAVDLTPTGFQVALEYDPERLEPVAVTRIGDGVLRAVNLSAGPGLIRAAGAAPSGLDSDVLFAVDLKIKAPGYGETLRLDVRELTVLEDNFADASADIVPAARAVVLAN